MIGTISHKVRIFLCLIISIVSSTAQTEWRTDLYAGGGEYWRSRVEIMLTNSSAINFDGEPVELSIGNSNNEIPIAGEKADAIRVCDENGVELLWSIRSSNDTRILKGEIPNGSKLIIPASIPSFSTTTLYLYFDNPSAWAVPDFYEASTHILNNSVEQGENNVPIYWQHDQPDEKHRVYWVEENPHSGKKCLKTVVSNDAEPSWISTRQHNIKIHPGGRYVFKGFVRAQNVKGSTGWYIHVGNSEKPLMISPTATLPGGTFDWREVSVEFTAPTNADRANVGTVLYGTGAAWFDDARLEAIEESNPVKIIAIKTRRLPELKIQHNLSTSPAVKYRSDLSQSISQRTAEKKELKTQWIKEKQYFVRLPFKIDNLLEQKIENTLLMASLKPILTRYGRFLNKNEIAVTDFDGNKIEYTKIGDQLFLFQSSIEPLSRLYFYAYFSEKTKKDEKETVKTIYNPSQNPALPGGDLLTGEKFQISVEQYKKLLFSPANLVKNPDFETGEKSPEFWSAGGIDSKEIQIESGAPGLFGKKAAFMKIPATASKSWRGWRQTVSIKGGKFYFYACWIKCGGVTNGYIKLHAHAKNSKGQICKDGGYLSSGENLSGTRDWTLLSGICKMPVDARDLELHLTTDTTGEIYHDGVLLAEINQCVTLPLQWNPEIYKDDLTIWQTPTIIKVFHDDMPARKIDQIYISAAKNEREPLQLAINSSRNIEIQVNTTPPKHSSGALLPAPEIGIVGYVPIDYVSGYYQNNSPDWIRKKPTHSGGSDGWEGYWPDPILPTNAVKLFPNQTQPIWLTFFIPKDSRAGEYTGTINLMSAGKTIKKINYTLRVWDFELPEKRNVKAIYDVRASLKKWAPDGTTEDQLRKAIWEFMAERRLCPDTIKPEPKIQYKNGVATADFSEFDRAARYYLEQLGFPHFYTPWQFYCFGWGLPPGSKFGEAPYAGKPPYENVDREILRPEFKKAYQQCLKIYWEHLKANNWDDRCLLYISDEPFDHFPEIRKQMKALCKMIYEVDPKIPVYSSTWHHQPDWDGYISVWGLGHYGVAPADILEHIRKNGARILWTTDGHMCIDTPFLAIERLLPHYSFHYGTEGYEFWGFDWLTYDPYEFGWHSFIRQSDQPGKVYWVRYPNGDGYLIYPGKKFGRIKPVPSIRSELAAEGCEDYEYLKLLKEKMNSKNKSAVKEAEQIMALARSLVFMPSAGGRFSSLILPNPELVYEIREQIAKTIEKLNK